MEHRKPQKSQKCDIPDHRNRLNLNMLLSNITFHDFFAVLQMF